MSQLLTTAVVLVLVVVVVLVLGEMARDLTVAVGHLLSHVLVR